MTSSSTPQASEIGGERPRPANNVRIGDVRIDDVTFDGALDAVEALITARKGGMVFTPNIDHIVLAEEDVRLHAAYEDVDLSLVDGTPVLWAARLLGHPLPEKISGSDLCMPLLRRAAIRGWRVYFLGGPPGVGEKAAELVRAELPSIQIVGVDAPFVNLEKDDPRHPDVVARIVAAKPDVVLVAFGCPKQEVFIHRVSQAIAPAVALGIGAGLDFIAGTVARAPSWISKVGLEWAYRLAREPRRLWRRYLVRDPKFLLILLREMRRSRA
jgi:N-acetylglucosaminyldiphosphoundecaprenol N-acetyl-beta-D-mannosaminyltransferase